MANAFWLRWPGHLDGMDETEKSKGRNNSRTYEERKTNEMRWWNMKWSREACASIMPKTKASGDDAAE